MAAQLIQTSSLQHVNARQQAPGPTPGRGEPHGNPHTCACPGVSFDLRTRYAPLAAFLAPGISSGHGHARSFLIGSMPDDGTSGATAEGVPPERWVESAL